MFRRHYPDLDLLESPLTSAGSISSFSGGLPGSAIAEKIFNDPESWKKVDDGIFDEYTKDQMAWLDEELRQYDEVVPFPTIALKPFSGKFQVKPTPSNTGLSISWEGVMEEEKPYISIFERSKLDLDLPFSKIWESGKIIRSIPSPVVLSPSSPCLPTETRNPGTRPEVSSHTTLETIVEKESESSPIVSPVAVASASSNWSILELYGAHPGTPCLELGHEDFEAYPPTPVLPSPPVPLPPRPFRTTPSPQPGTPLSTTPKPKQFIAPSPVLETTTIRRLPVIPGAPQNSPSPAPMHVRIPRGIHRKGSLPLHPRSSSLDNYSSPFMSSSPQPSRPGSASRSPPAGPRPRSDTLPTKGHKTSVRESSFTMSPASHHSRRSPSLGRIASPADILCGIQV